MSIIKLGVLSFFIFLIPTLILSLSTTSISYLDLYQGITLDGFNLNFFSATVTDTLQNAVDIEELLNEKEFYFVAYISPYICGACERQSINLINQLAARFPGQVIFIVRNDYFKEAISSIRKVQFDKSVILLLDTDGKNIEKISNISNHFFDIWQFVISKNNEIEYLRALDYQYKQTPINYRTSYKYIINRLSIKKSRD